MAGKDSNLEESPPGVVKGVFKRRTGELTGGKPMLEWILLFIKHLSSWYLSRYWRRAPT